MSDLPDQPRRVLFLQGPPNGFWRELAGAFEAAGHETRRINFSTADWLAWRRPGAEHYRGRFSRWPGFIADYLARERITDVLYFADRLPYHAEAAEAARGLGIPCHACEFGYLRPDWLTLERTGMGAFSHFPADPDRLRGLAAMLPPPPPRGVLYGHSFFQEARDELLFNLVNALFCWPYPLYRMDKAYHPLADYISWLPRLARGRSAARHAEAVTRACAAESAPPWHLVALQLEADYQIRDNSPFRSLSEAIEMVIASFAAHAPAEQRLVFKLHPLDNGLESWPQVIADAAARHGVAERVETIDGGALDALIQHAQGVVTVNSTVGLHAIRADRAVMALAPAVYAMPGLTHQGGLDAFWASPEPPDPELVEALLRVLAATIQVRGSFYHPQGREAAAREIVRRVAGGLVNQPGAFEETPPRLAALSR